MNDNSHYIVSLEECISGAKSDAERNFYQNKLDVFVKSTKEFKEQQPKKIKRMPFTISEHKTFINGFGEATKREIVCPTYLCQQKQLTKRFLY